MSQVVLHRENYSKVFYSYILTIYLASSVINWLPLIDASLVRGVKYFFFIIIFLYELRNNNLKFPSFFLSPFGLIVIIFSMLFGLVLSFRLNALIDIIIPFLMLWVFNHDRNFYYKAIFRAAMIVAFICVLSIGSNFTGIYNVQPPGWDFSFGQAGFGGYSTGYSNSLFLFVPFLIFWHRRNNKPLISIETIAIVFIIIAQYLTGGRGGFLASGIVFFLSFRIHFFYKIVLIGTLAFIAQSQSFLDQMRISTLNRDRIDVNRISTGRVELTAYYFEKFKERPVFGYGFGPKDEINKNVDVHIVWLRNAVDGGIIYMVLLVILFIEILRTFLKNKTLEDDERKLFRTLFFVSFLITFLEPNYLIGSVQGEIVYWLLISLLLKKIVIVKNRGQNNVQQVEQKDLAYH